MKLSGIKKCIVFSGIFLSACGNQSNIAPVPILNTVGQTQTAPLNQEAEANSLFSREKSIFSIVSAIVSEYDHNKNAQIDYRDSNTIWKDLISRNENNRHTTYTSHNSQGQKEIVRTTYSMSSLFVASDKNADGIASLEEIVNLVKERYDKNDDDILNSRGWKFWKEADEKQLFNREFPEKMLSRKTISRDDIQINSN